MDLGVFQLEDTWTGISGSIKTRSVGRSGATMESPDKEGSRLSFHLAPQFLLSVFADSLLMLTLPLTAVRLEGCFVESVVEVSRCIFFFCWLNVI